MKYKKYIKLNLSLDKSFNLKSFSNKIAINAGTKLITSVITPVLSAL